MSDHWQPWLLLLFALCFGGSLWGWFEAYRLGKRNGRELERMLLAARRRQEVEAAQALAYEDWAKASPPPEPKR